MHSDLATSSNRATPFFSYAVAIALLVLAGVLLVVASMPYLDLKAQLEALTLHGHADVFTAPLHQRIVILLSVAAAACVAVALVVFVLRNQISWWAGYAASSVTSFTGEVYAEARSALRSESRAHLSVLASVLLIGFALRMLYLFQPMRYDEAYTFTHFASTPIYLAVSNFSSTNNHLFNTVLMKVSYLLLGNQVWVLRLPAFLAGWLLIPATYVVTRAFFNRNSALVAAALVASSSFLILFSTNARGYTLMSLFFLLLLALAPYCLRSNSPGPWILFSVVTALGFYSLPTMLYGFAMIAGWMFLTVCLESGAERIARMKRLVLASMGGAVLTVLLYSPVILVWGTNMRNTDVLPQAWDRFVAEVPAAALSAWRQWSVAVPDWMMALLAGGFAVAVVGSARVSRFRVPLVVSFLWILPVLLVQRVVPYDRVWIFLLPFYFIVVSAGLELLWRRLAPSGVPLRREVVGILGLVLALGLGWNVVATQSVYYADDTGSLRDGESIAAWMKDNLRQRDIVLAVVPADGPLEYYLPKLGLKPADYWYSTQIKGPTVEPGRRVLAVVKDRGPDLDKMLKTAGLDPAGISTPELVRRFSETGIYQFAARSPGN